MAVYPQVLLPDPIYLQAETYSAQDDRRQMGEVGGAPGVIDRASFKISLVSGRTVRCAAGIAYVKGRNVSDQGMYRVSKTTTHDVTLNAGDASNPRIDQIIVRVMDNAHDSAGFNETRVEAVVGTPTGGATLDNRTGALNLDSLGEASKNTLLLCDILMPTSATTVTAGNMRDRRSYCQPVIPVPEGYTDTLVDVCPLEYVAPMYNPAAVTHASNDLDQVATLVRVPRPITTDGIKWTYAQGSPAMTGNYVYALYDASGRVVVQTASTAFAGALDTHQSPTVAWTAGDTLIEAGMYWLLWGMDSGAGGCDFWGVNPVPGGQTPSPIIGNVPALIVGSTSGGVTVPTTLLALTDAYNTSLAPVPFALLVRST